MPNVQDLLLIIAIVLPLMMITAKAAFFCINNLGISTFVELLILGTVILSLYSASTATPKQIEHFFSELSKGFYNCVGLFILLTILTRLWKNKLTAPEMILILTVLVNAVLNIAPMQIFHKTFYIPSRYLYVALPLWSGFFIIGIQGIYDFLGKHLSPQLRKTVLYASCLAVAGSFLFHDIQMLHRDYTRNYVRRASAMQLVKMIRSDYDGPATGEIIQTLNVYKSKKRPRIFFKELSRITVTAYLSGGSLADWYKDADYVVTTGNLGKVPVKLKLIGKTDVPGQPEYSLWRVIK